MKQIRVLVLTDHSGHSRENSIYALISEMVAHESCQELYVASRGNAKNKNFFSGLNDCILQAMRVEGTFMFDASGDQFISETHTVHVREFDFIFLRLPRPVSDEFLHFIKKIDGEKVIINDPTGIMTCSTKEFLLNFPDLCPPMRLCHTVEDVSTFLPGQSIVLKPLREYGGKGLVKITGDTLDDGDQLHDTRSYLEENKSTLAEGYLAMKYLKNVTEGDKRIIVVGGEIMACSLRLPPPDSWVCNVARGGTSVSTSATPEEESIIKHINPLLQKHGIFIYGADTLVNDEGKRVLSEINTLSIGGFPQAQKQTGQPIIKITINKIFDHIHNACKKK